MKHIKLFITIDEDRSGFGYSLERPNVNSIQETMEIIGALELVKARQFAKLQQTGKVSQVKE